jgi:cytochrome P450
MLANNPEAQKKVHSEIDAIYGTEQIDLDTSLEDLRNMSYLELVIKESLRLIPPGPFLGRKLGADVELKDGRIIPGGTDVLICVPEIHRDPENYPDPEEFIPERFLLENKNSSAGMSNIKAYSYLSFSAGPRNCLGQHYAMHKTKLLVSKILQRFQVTTNKRLHEVILLYGIVVEPVGGFPINLSPRWTNCTDN